MQMDLYPFGMKGFELVKNIDGSTVIRGVGDIERNEMELSLCQNSIFAC